MRVPLRSCRRGDRLRQVDLRGVARHHLCDPPDDQPELPEEPPPQLLLLPLLLPPPPLVKRAPGELAPVAAMTTITA